MSELWVYCSFIYLFIHVCYCRARSERRGDRTVKWVRAARVGPESAAAWGSGSAAPACSQRSTPAPWFHSPQPLPQLPTGGTHSHSYTLTHKIQLLHIQFCWTLETQKASVPPCVLPVCYCRIMTQDFASCVASFYTSRSANINTICSLLTKLF